jgi:hypothetical protein
MQQLGPMEVRVVHEFERPRVLEMSENQRRLQLEALRFERARRPAQAPQLRAWAARAVGGAARHGAAAAAAAAGGSRGLLTDGQISDFGCRLEKSDISRTYTA